MGDDEQGDPAGETDRAPAFFVILDPVLDRHSERISKDLDRIFETHAVLTQVGLGLFLVPFELRRHQAM
jgi:hypothetical protein